MQGGLGQAIQWGDGVHGSLPRCNKGMSQARNLGCMGATQLPCGQIVVELPGRFRLKYAI